MVVFLLVAGVAHAAPSKESLQELQEKIQNLKQELGRNEGAHHEAADALKQSEQEISETNRKLNELRQQQKANAATLGQLGQQQSHLQTTIQQQQQLLSTQFYRQYLNGQQGYLRILLEQQDPNVVERNLQYFRYVAQARSKLITSLRHNLGQVTELNTKTEATLNKVALLKNEQEKNKQDLKKQQAEHKAVMSSLALQIQAQRGEITKLQRDEKRITELLQRLARIAAATPKKKTTKKSLTKDTSDSKTESKGEARNEVVPEPLDDNGVFAALRGKLRLPTKGELTNKFGAARPDSGISWKGIFIRANEGNEVRSIANGRVVFADWLRGFGNLLIVDHGEGYMSLYGNNQALFKKVGDEVQAGDHVAAIGNSGGNPESGLYFELRHKSKPLDPLSWCALK
ncbi:MAG: peptidoglycan DD-metalloendopeptidase family protein [Methylophilales bacterium]|nr:peptidoglycan DD-metalloendopeptidase family protein [Methylophilales bacterium]